MSEHCNTCKFCFEEKGTSSAVIHVCRRYPPAWMILRSESPVVGVMGGGTQIMKQTDHPSVTPAGWCGEYSPVAEKIN